MPKKHAVSFKHLIATSSRDQDLLYDHHNSNRNRTYPNENQNQSSAPVQELLDRSRSARPTRPVRPDLVDDEVGGQAVTWIPRPAGRLDLELEEGPTELHPAERLRRAQLAHRRAQRSVAGPAPPPSWRSSRQTAAAVASSSRHDLPEVSATDLSESSRLFSQASGGRIPSRRSYGTARLLEHCFAAVIRYLDSNEVVWSTSTSVSNPDAYSSSHTVTLGRAMREGLPYLDTHLKIALLNFHSALPRKGFRLSDRSIRALFLPTPTPAPGIETHEDGWEEPVDRTALIHHLGITLHPSPHTLIRNISLAPLAALTSLNLAYTVIPKDTERLVNVLPVGLRELSLVGVRYQGDEKEWARFMALLGRKLIVLKMLDISYPPHGIGDPVLENLLHPPTRQLPSLRILGLRGCLSSGSLASNARDSEKGDESTGSRATSQHRRDMIRTIRQDRAQYIDVVWD